MDNSSFITRFAQEFEAEIPATRKCLERIPESLYDWKPHETSATMGYLTQLVAEIPKWLAVMISDSVIDFKTFQHMTAKNTGEMLAQFDDHLQQVREALKDLTDDRLSKPFVLKDGDNIMINSSLAENLASTLNHWIHHRGQLTVYMRLRGIAVPSIYGPSGDENPFRK
ncbi:MAG: DinB family protein [Bacteroidota bacterium]